MEAPFKIEPTDNGWIAAQDEFGLRAYGATGDQAVAALNDLIERRTAAGLPRVPTPYPTVEPDSFPYWSREDHDILMAEIAEIRRQRDEEEAREDALREAGRAKP